jgi:4-aminobutyrate aminotransferase
MYTPVTETGCVPMSEQTRPTSSNEDIESNYDEYMMPIWKSLDVPIKQAEGCYVEDYDGNEYLDVFSGISVTNAGHGNEAMVDAAHEQLDSFIHGCSYVHPSEPVADLAETLAEVTPGDLKKSFFCNSGTEAVEGAIKLARKYTGSKEILALEMGFHGRTLGSLALTGNKTYKSEMAPTINDVAHTAPPYAYRCQKCDGNSCTSACAEDVERVIDTHTADDLAAVVVEPVMGEAGLIAPPEGWLERVQEITHERDALLIADEVQTGFGRTGEMWGVDHYDVVPDIMPQAKGIANGLPLGAFTASEEVADAFESGDHLSTFGGNPVACAAAEATITELQNGILDNAREQGEWLGSELAAIEADYDIVGEARGLGLMRGLELVRPDGDTGPMGVAPEPAPKYAKQVSEALREENVIIGVGGFHKNVMRLQPPLTISQAQLETALDALRSALESVSP